MPVFIDTPAESLETSGFIIAGWVAAMSDNPLIEVSINGHIVPYGFNERPDVRQVMDGFRFVSGVFAQVDLLRMPLSRDLTITLECGTECHQRQISLTEAAFSAWATETMLRAENRAFCLERLRCAGCGRSRDHLDLHPGQMTCRGCGAQFRQDFAALNMISDDLQIAANIHPTANVSSNPYPPATLDLIERTTAHGGWVLDCGAGSRDRRRPRVVNVEIVDYTSTDMLAIGESLPFADNSFDAAISLAVLEHVRDPFRCAKELLRVVKPGGEILADVPFLQPVHGYPNHYYNMTQQGLQNLFGSEADIISCTVPPHGHPIFGVRWILNEYTAGLPETERLRFEALTVGELRRTDPAAFLHDPMASRLSEQASSITACLNTLLVRKR